MILSDTIQLVIEVEGAETFYSERFINMLDDMGAFIEMPFAKPILKEMWDKNYHLQIAEYLNSESNLRSTIVRILDYMNRNRNRGFDRDSLETTCSELIRGLGINWTLHNNSSSDYTKDVIGSKGNTHLAFQGYSMSNSIKSLSSLLIRNSHYRIVEEKQNEIQLQGEFAGIEASFINLNSEDSSYTKSIMIGFYEEDETLRSLKGQLLMTKLNLDYGQPIEDPIYGLKWMSDGGFISIIPFQEVVAVVYRNMYSEIVNDSTETQKAECFNPYLTYGLNDIEKLNFLYLLKTDFNTFISSANGLPLTSKKVSKLAEYSDEFHRPKLLNIFE